MVINPQKQTSAQDEIVGRLIQEHGRRSAERANFDTQWREVAERVLPMHSTLFQGLGTQTKGEKRNEFVYDSTPVIANERFAAIVDSLLTPRNQTYHAIVTDDPFLQKDRATKLWFEEVTRILFRARYAPVANFASQNQQVYLSLGGYGSAVMFPDEMPREKAIRYKNLHLSQCYFAENHQGIVDDLLRYFPMTARQAVMEFGEQNLPESIVSAMKVNPDQEFFFIHCIKPNLNMDPERADYRGMPFVSYTVSIEGRKFIKEGGFLGFPCAIPRYNQAPGEAYGRGPAMSVLPAIKTLNEMKKTVLKQGQKTVDPVLLVPDDGVLNSLRPGAQNQGGVNKDGKPLVHALPVGRIDIGQDLMNDERQVINDANLVTLFQILVETPTMTATEVMERTREKGILLAPTLGRLQSEYLGPLIEREMDLLSAMGMLPPMPPLLLEARGEYSIRYDSPLSRAQRAEEASGLMRTLELALKWALEAQDPRPLDHFNPDTIIPDLADIQGVKGHWLNSAEAIQMLREQRASMQQQQMDIAAAPGAAALAKAGAVVRQAS